MGHSFFINLATGFLASVVGPSFPVITLLYAMAGFGERTFFTAHFAKLFPMAELSSPRYCFFCSPRVSSGRPQSEKTLS